ncbi:cytidine deaminase [Lacipirellula sp.]|uniref:cytidine deaminase n=1 Tax=Lacipirellula sp. TaxID=2691419 RepID=UPI003D0C038F
MGPNQQKLLANAAQAVRSNAYAPYSRFHVGAALLAADGEIFAGCNVENASYGLTICAERVAIGSAVAAGHRQIVAVAVATSGGHSPCGACRQVLSEFGPAMEVILIDADDPTRTRTTTLAALLPEQFSSGAL